MKMNKEAKDFIEYHEFGLQLKEYVKNFNEKIDNQAAEIYKLKVENRKWKSFVKTELASFISDHMALGRKIDAVVADNERLSELAEKNK